MENTMKCIAVYLDSEASAWLDRQAVDGYKKASLVRHMIHERMEKEKASMGAGQ